ncbi:MAG: type VII secretion protein EccCa [Streptosporangiales bacterium]|nr:type VII secretion protein EccCa [Streptosporangiales bacterium]
MSTVVFRRPPRKASPELPRGEVALVPPPELPTTRRDMTQVLYMLPMVAGGGAMAMLYAGRGGGPLTYVVGGLFGVSMLGMAAMAFLRPTQGKKSEVDEERRDYMRYLGQTRKQVRDVAEQQRKSLLWRHPDPDVLWSLGASNRLWERRTSDEDFALIRLGLGNQHLATPLIPPQTVPVEDLEPMAASGLRRFVRTYSIVPDLPIAVSLRSFTRVSLIGDRPLTAGLARAMLGQLATFHSPDDLEIWVCTSQDRRADWEWVKWMPHAQHRTATDAAGPVRMVASRLEELEALAESDLAERPRFSPNTPLPGDTPHIVVIVDGGGMSVESQLADADGVLGVTLIELAGAQIPAFDPDADRNALRLVVERDRLGVVGETGVEKLGEADTLSRAQAEALARLLSPIRLSGAEEDEEEPLAAHMGLTELLGLGDPHSIDPTYTWRPRAPRDRLRVPIGVGPDGATVDLDIKESAEGGMGPHGLCIGATGSGKSELLRTLVAGLAVTHSSETLNLVLVDFKGGATFAGMAELPHTAAVITNLADDLTLVDRMQDALNGEMVRRQELLKAAGNFQSVRDYERARQRGADLEPLPSLFIVCDEFSELLSAKPDFIDLFVAIGRLGRSLAMHLMLASQRLEEGRLRGLDSHLSYRIALRTFSGAESRVVIGVPDAYELPPVPGSGYLRPDPASLVRFKGAYVSGAYKPRGGVSPRKGIGRTVTANVIPFTTAYLPPDTPLEPPKEDREQDTSSDDEPAAPGQTVLDVVVDQLESHGPPAHRIWLPPLTEPSSLDELLPRLGLTPDRGLCPVGWEGNGRLTVPVAIVDKPFEQRRDLLWANLAGAQGHAVVVGRPQSGKSTLVRALISTLALSHTPEEVQVYCLDFGGGTLASLDGLPHVGSVASRLEPDVVRRTVAEMITLLDERERDFQAQGIDSMATFRARRSQGKLEDRFGDVFLIVDGWGQLRENYEPLEQSITSIAQRGLNYGVHVVITAQRWAEMRPALRDLLGTRFELRLGDPSESEIDRRTAMNVPEGMPGRGVGRDKLHFLTAVPRIDGKHSDEDLVEGVADMVKQVAEAWTRPPAPPVRLLPFTFPAEDLPKPEPGKRLVPIGIQESDLGPVYLDFSTDPHFLCFGDVECGKSDLLRVITRGVMSRYTSEEARIIVVDYRRALLDVSEGDHMLGYATSSTMLSGMINEVRGSMQRRLPGPDVTRDQLIRRDWWSGPELFLIVDDYDLVATASGNPLAPLADFLPQARDIGLHVIMARSVNGVSRAMFEPVLARIKEGGSPGLVMSGRREEGQVLGDVRPSEQPPGRGTLVSRRRGAQLVQVAWLPAQELQHTT